MKSLKLSKQDLLVYSKWRWLIRGTEEDTLTVSGTGTSSPRLYKHKYKYKFVKGGLQIVPVR